MNLAKHALRKMYGNAPTVFLATLIIYVYLRGSWSTLANASPTPYYNYLIDALLDGRLNLISPNVFDLSLYDGKWYMYWGPAPVLFIFPFYLLLGGVAAPDTLYTLIAGVGNVGLFYYVIEEFVTYLRLEASVWHKTLVVLSFAFASPNLLNALMGQVWFTNQTIAVFYLLVGYIFYFKFLNRADRLRLFLLAVLFFNLAWFSRNSLVFQGLLLFYPLTIAYERNRTLFKQMVVGGLAITLTFLFVIGFYNYARFDSAFESGHRYHKGAERYMQTMDRRFSVENIPHNITYYFLNHLAVNVEREPYMQIDYEGNSVFSVYPLSILFLWICQRAYLKNRFILLQLSVIALTMGLFLVFFATGWGQFGLRYLLDITPLAFLLTLVILREIPLFVQILILTYGIAVNVIGVTTFLY
jgi:hypothetical protein